MLKLDVKDKKILSILDMDARSPLSKIAKAVGLSREVVTYRIKQLEKKKVIEGYYAAIDLPKLGLMYGRLQFSYNNMSKKKKADFTEYCNKHPKITWLFYTDGEYHIALVVVVKNLQEFHEVHDDIREHFGDFVQNPLISFGYKIYHYKYNFLYDTHDLNHFILGEEYNENYRLDTFDTQLLTILNKDAHLNLVELAQKLKSTTKRVSYRIKKLIKDKIILGFRAKINTKILGFDRYHVDLHIKKCDKEKQGKLLKFPKQHQKIIYSTIPIGYNDLEFEINVKNANELYEIMENFKELFSKMEITYSKYLMFEEPILSYFPLTGQEEPSHLES